MTRIRLVAALAAATIASASAFAESADPGGPTAGPRDPGLAVQPMPAGPGYPGPGVDTWLGRRYPPPAPPEGMDDLSSGQRASGPRLVAPRMGAADILAAAGASPRGDEFDECMAQAGDMDFVEALCACFCLTVGDQSSGCAADGY